MGKSVDNAGDKVWVFVTGRLLRLHWLLAGMPGRIKKYDKYHVDNIFRRGCAGAWSTVFIGKQGAPGLCITLLIVSAVVMAVKAGGVTVFFRVP